MNKFIATLTITALALIGTSAALASPCGAELCLSAFKAAKMAVGCKSEMDDFFSIKRTKHGKFSPSRTYQARRDYLYKCDSGNTAQKEHIMSKFGHIYKPSY